LNGFDSKGLKYEYKTPSGHHVVVIVEGEKHENKTQWKKAKNKYEVWFDSLPIG